jgi:hypothetical protein
MMFEKYVPKFTDIDLAIKEATHKEFLKCLEYYSTQDSPELRKKILASGRADLLLAYSIFYIESRWEEAEQTILYNNTKPYNLAVYATFIIGGRWPEAEPIIMTDPKTMYCYVCDVLKERWMDAEEYWAKQNVAKDSSDDYELKKYYRKFQLEYPHANAQALTKEEAVVE